MTDELSFVDLYGRRQTWQVHQVSKSPAQDNDICTAMITLIDGRVAQQKWVPADIAKERPAACDSLENEARVGYRLLDRFIEGHPQEFVEVHGHDLDAAEPFLLAERPRGRPVTEIAARLNLDEQDAFERGLFKALHCLADIGVVHGALSPHTVRWDRVNATVQLDGFGYATSIGEPAPARVPEQMIPGWTRPPTRRVASHGDDVWAAGQVVLYVVTGRGDPADLSSRGPALRSLLDGVFADTVDSRPDASVLLRRLSAPPYTVAALTGAGERFAEGLRKFDEALARKPRPEKRRPQERRSPGYGAGATEASPEWYSYAVARQSGLQVPVLVGVAAALALVMVLVVVLVALELSR